MHFFKRVFVSTVAAALAMVGAPGAGLARGFNPGPMVNGYSGSFSVTVTNSQHSNWTGCLMLEQGGEATFVLDSQKYHGSYTILNSTFVATVEAQGYSQNAGLLFIGRAERGKIGAGAFEDVYGGSDFDSGDLAFGAKGSC